MKHCDNGENMRTCRSEESYLSDKCLTLRGYDGGVQKAHVPPKLQAICITQVKTRDLSDLIFFNRFS
jgi:hypothetical protein